MVRSAFSKVMWVGRATVFLVGLAVVLALILGLASRATAHTGFAGLFHLNHNNPVSKVSSLTANMAGRVLQVTNNGTANGSAAIQANNKSPAAPAVRAGNSGGGPALGLNVGAGKAPLTVNASAGKAQNLDADKLDGKDANDLAVKPAFASGGGPSPNGTLQFLAPPATVNVGAGQAVQVTSHRALGSIAAGGASGLDLYICHRPQGSAATPNHFGGGMLGNRVPQNTRVPMGLSAVIPNLPAGDHQVGLCGRTIDGNTNWNLNEYGYTSAMAVTPPSGGDAALSTMAVQER